MNKYLEKVATMKKVAYDMDYDEGGEYGVSANRSIGNHMVHDMLSKAAKDPDVHVTLSTPDGEVHSSKTSPEKLTKALRQMKSVVGNKTSSQHLKAGTMQWHRDYSWSMGMSKKNPSLQQYYGKKTKQGDIIKDPKDAILHHLRTKYNY